MCMKYRFIVGFIVSTFHLQALALNWDLKCHISTQKGLQDLFIQDLYSSHPLMAFNTEEKSPNTCTRSGRYSDRISLRCKKMLIAYSTTSLLTGIDAVTQNTILKACV